MEKFYLKTNIFFFLILIITNLIKINSVIVPLDPKVQERILKALNEIRESKITKYEIQINVLFSRDLNFKSGRADSD